MNIVGFISALLIMFSISLSFLLGRHVQSEHLHRSFHGYMQAERNLRSFCAKKYLPKAPRPKEASAAKPDETRVKKNKKKRQKTYDCAKFNLMPLFIDKVNPQSRQTFARLLSVLYGETLLKDPAVKEQIITGMIEGARRQLSKQTEKEKQIVEIEKIAMTDKSLQIIYYQMLKGTKLGGLPALCDFAAFETKPQKICIKHASAEVLTALLNRRAATEIIKARELKKLSSADLENLLRSIHYPLSESIREHFSFAHFKVKALKTRQLSGYDSGSQIRLKRQTPIS